MHWQYTPYVAPLILAAVVSAPLTVYAWRRRAAPGAAPLALFMLAVAVWSLGTALELAGADVATKVFWAEVQYLGVVTVPAAWLAFALQYTDTRDQAGRSYLTRRNLALLAIEPLMTLLLVLTNDYHGLMWGPLALQNEGVFLVLDWHYGLWFWFNVAYSYVLLLVGLVRLVQVLWRSPGLYRGQIGVLLLGVLVPWAASVAYVTDSSPFPYLDLTPFAFTLTGLAVMWNLFRFGFLNLVPIARETVIEKMSEGVIVLDAQNRVVDINPAACRFLNCTAAGTIGGAVGQVFAAWPDLERYRNVPDAHEEISVGEGEAQRYFDVRISPLSDWRGRLTGHLIVLRDITERKRVEAALRESEARYRALVEQIPPVVYMDAIDEVSSALYISPQVETLLGYSPDEWRADPALWTKLLHPDDRERTLAENARTNATGEPFRAEYRLIARDGHVVWIRDEAVLLRDDAGQPRYRQGVMLDVTARKRAEEALAAERSLLRTLIDIVPDYIYVKDTASRFLAANVAVARAMGASTPQDLLGKSDYDFYPERLAAEYRADEQAILRAGQPVINKDDPRVDPTGNRRAVLTTKVPFRDSQGKIIGLVGIGRDITERKRVEEAEREQRQLADTLRDIGMHLAAELNPDAILDILLEHVARVVPYDSASVMFLEDSHIRVKRSRGYERFGVAHLIGDFDLELATLGYLRRIAETRRPHIVADTRADPLWVEMETSRHIRSWAGAPIMARGQVLGFISLDKTEPNFYTPELAERLAAFAVQAGLALDNARLYAEQQRLAITDELTRIHNRRHLFELGEREFRRARRFGHVLSVIMLDIDHFKQVNDTYGHAVGDQVLLVLAERCRKNIRDVDVLGRYGGEEFAIILPETGLPAACEAAERLRQCVAQTRIPTNAGPLGITISLGVAALTESIRDLPSLLDRADAAMYAAKQAGRNRVSVG